MRNVVEDILLLYRLTGWQGRRVPALLPKPGCPPQAASHHGWSCVRWGTLLPLWFGFLGLKRHNYVITGKCRINQKHQSPVNNSFSFFHKLATQSLLYFSILLISAFSPIFRLSFFSHRCKCFKCFLGTGFGCPSLLYSVNYCSECHLHVVCSLDPSKSSNLFYPIQILHLAILWASQTDLDKMKPWPPSPAWFAFQ